MKKTNTNFKYTPKPNEDSDSSEGDDIKLPDDKKIILPVLNENLEMLYNVCYDIFEKLSFSKLENLNKNIDDAKNELEAVRKYYNKSIEKTKKILGCESLDVSNLNNTWTFTY